MYSLLKWIYIGAMVLSWILSLFLLLVSLIEGGSIAIALTIITVLLSVSITVLGIKFFQISYKQITYCVTALPWLSSVGTFIFAKLAPYHLLYGDKLPVLVLLVTTFLSVIALGFGILYFWISYKRSHTKPFLVLVMCVVPAIVMWLLVFIHK